MLIIWHAKRSQRFAFARICGEANGKKTTLRTIARGSLPQQASFLLRKKAAGESTGDSRLSHRRSFPLPGLPAGGAGTGHAKEERNVRMKERSIEMAKCVLVYCLGLFIMALGVSFSGTADLGMSPVNSIPYVLSEIFTSLSMGTWIIIIFSLYILIQFVILGRDFQPWRILQLICTTLFGYFTDFTNFLADLFLPDPAQMTFAPAVVYGVRLLYLFISMVLIALGILFYLAPNLISLPGEGIMQVIAHKLNKPLPVIKMCFDCTVSLIALAISLAYFRQFHGIREGTVIAAFGVGKILGLYEPLKPAVHRFMHGLEREETAL